MNPNGPNCFRSFDSWPLQLFQQRILACSRQGASGLRDVAEVLRCRLHHVHKNATSAWDEWPWDCHGKIHISTATAYFKWQFWRLLLATKSFRLFGGKCSLERSWHTFLPPADVMLLDVLLLSVWYLPISLLFVLYKCFIFLDKIICCSTQHLFWDTSDVHFPISQKQSFMQQQKEHLRHPGLRLVKLLGLPTKLTIFAASFCQFLPVSGLFQVPRGVPGLKKKRNHRGSPRSSGLTSSDRLLPSFWSLRHNPWPTYHDLPNLPNWNRFFSQLMVTVGSNNQI